MKRAGRTIAPFETADLNGVLQVLEEALPGDPISATRFTRQVLLDSNFCPRGALVARIDGAVTGFCLSIARQVPLENAPQDTDRGYITLLAVRPSAQRQGIGSALLKGAEQYLQTSGRQAVLVSPYAPGYFFPGVDRDQYAPALSLFSKNGYRDLDTAIAMEAPLWQWTVPAWVIERERRLTSEGLTLEEYHPGLTLPLLEFMRREFPGDWVRVARETAGRILGGDSPSRLIAACEADRVLGFAHYENERFGPIGVSAAERGRGIGQALMFRTLRAMRQQGFRSAWFLWSDQNTARRLYDSAGFRTIRRFTILRKDFES